MQHGLFQPGYLRVRLRVDRLGLLPERIYGELIPPTQGYHHGIIMVSSWCHHGVIYCSQSAFMVMYLQLNQGFIIVLSSYRHSDIYCTQNE